jgi:hypothetical protein
MAFTDHDQVRYWLNPVQWLARKSRNYAQSASQHSPFAMTEDLALIIAQHAYDSARAQCPTTQRKPSMHQAFVEMSLLADAVMATVVGASASQPEDREIQNKNPWIVNAVTACGYTPKSAKPVASVRSN